MNPIPYAQPFLFARPIMLLMGSVAIWASPAFALDGVVQIHDPSTIIQCDGRFYTYGTGGSTLVSDDGWIWGPGVTPARRGMAPDLIHLGARYYLYVAANIGGQPRAAINVISSKSLDPQSPDYQWEEGGIVASSDGTEFCNAIDPGVFRDPTDGKLWLVYGSYFGYIRLVQLDPKTGKRLDPTGKPVDIAINCEASDMIYRDGWYYLLATHGSCCRAPTPATTFAWAAPESDGALPRPHGPRYARRRRQALRRLRRARHRPRPLWPARFRRWHAEILLPFRGRPR